MELRLAFARRLGAGLSLLLLGLACSSIARDASSEVGRWRGFVHSGAGAGNITLDLVANPDISPLALQGSGIYSPLAIVIIGGLVSSTLLARLVTPVMYKLLPPAIVVRSLPGLPHEVPATP